MIAFIGQAILLTLLVLGVIGAAVGVIYHNIALAEQNERKGFSEYEIMLRHQEENERR